MDTGKGHLNRRELVTWVRFMFGARSLFQALDRRLRDECGLSMDDFDVLAAIRRFPDSKMSELADVLSFSPSRLTNVIQRMEAQGWVERREGEEDKRVKTLSLAPSGKAVLDQAWPRNAEAIRELFLDQLADEDRQVFDDAFTRIRKATRSSARMHHDAD